MKYLKYFEAKKLYDIIGDANSPSYQNVISKKVIEFSKNDISRIEKIINENNKKSICKVRRTDFSFIMIDFYKIDYEISYRIQKFDDDWFMANKKGPFYSDIIIDGWDGLKEFLKDACKITPNIRNKTNYI